jgi:hypothetical protein
MPAIIKRKAASEIPHLGDSPLFLSISLYFYETVGIGNGLPIGQPKNLYFLGKGI